MMDMLNVASIGMHTILALIVCQHIRKLQTSKNSPVFGTPCTRGLLHRPKMSWTAMAERPRELDQQF